MRINLSKFIVKCRYAKVTEEGTAMKVKIKILDEKAVIPFKTHKGDFCYDCVAVSEEEIAPNVWKYGLGIALQIDREEENPFCLAESNEDVNNGRANVRRWKMSIDARPRSSVWKTGMVLSNCVGTIDEPYTGEISAVFYHVMPDMPRYKVGDRVCQIKLGFTLPIEFAEVEELKTTERGDGGYGSTGK